MPTLGIRRSAGLISRFALTGGVFASPLPADGARLQPRRATSRSASTQRKRESGRGHL